MIRQRGEGVRFLRVYCSLGMKIIKCLQALHCQSVRYVAFASTHSVENFEVLIKLY